MLGVGLATVALKKTKPVAKRIGEILIKAGEDLKASAEAPIKESKAAPKPTEEAVVAEPAPAEPTASKKTAEKPKKETAPKATAKAAPKKPKASEA